MGKERDKIDFFVIKRLVRDKSEWTFCVKINNDSYWVIETWDHKPKREEIEVFKEISLRSMDIYRRYVLPPKFDPIITVSYEVKK